MPTAQSNRITGPAAGVEKYDLLTALAARGLANGGLSAVSMLRLIAVITARYNWAKDQVSIGHRELAQLWSVDERTAKRETKRLTEAGFLEVVFKGVRGRVSAYRLVRERIRETTRSTWQNVGSDFEERMAQPSVPEANTSVSTPEHDELVPDSQALAVGHQGPRTPWSLVLDRLRATAPASFKAWFTRIELAHVSDGEVTLRAPSNFVAHYILTNLRRQLELALQGAFGRPLRVSFERCGT